MNGNGFSTGNYQISGGIPNTGAQFIDGGPINNGYINAISYIPSQDSIQEFRVEGNAIGPEFGGTTNGVVTMVTKSGSDAFHGTAFNFLRNTVLNANNFFNIQAGLKRPVLIQRNEFGGTVGDPIKRIKYSSLAATRVFARPSAPPPPTLCPPQPWSRRYHQLHAYQGPGSI